MQKPVTVAFLFALIWASIQYTQGRITDLTVLAVDVAVFVVLGAALYLIVQQVVRWLKNRR